jgi:hypothetical protein
MKQELEEKLFSDFPLLFERNADIRNSAMGWGFECGNGWFNLIYDLAEELYPLIKKSREMVLDEYDCYPTVTKVKEKYGTLRFYMSTATDEMHDIIDKYEAYSAETCETCGKPGSVDPSRKWASVTCLEHRSK